MPLWLRYTVFFVTLFLLLGAANVYVHRRVGHTLALGRRGKVVTAVALLGGLIAMVAGRVLARAEPGPLSEALALVGSTIQLGAIIAAGLTLPMDLLRLGTLWLSRLRRRRLDDSAAGELQAPAPTLAHPLPDEALLLTFPRRTFVTRVASGAALAVGGGISTYGAIFGRHDYVIEEVSLPVPGLPATLEGFTVAQLSDIHFGAFVDAPELEAAVTLVARTRPDLVVLTGDLVDHDARFAPLVGRLVRRLAPLARHGVMAIPGNHDYYAGIDAVVRALEKAGATVLRNGGRVVGDGGGGFALLGVDDIWSSRYGLGPGADLERAIAMVPRDLPRVLLCHNPAFFPEAAGRVQVQLSGHTHGGQVNVLSRAPAELVLPYGYVAGRYDRDGSLLYVNRGFGVAGAPARVGSPPEVTRIALTRA